MRSTRTLDAMSSGGIYDHLAGGFARYSTDKHWLVPHFEKMLYDNALLVIAYTHAWQLTRSSRYRQVVEETVGYLLSPPIRLPEGAWALAEDADSEGKEGLFYTSSLAELDEVGGPAAAQWYGATAAGNWEGTNILWRPRLAICPPAEVDERNATVVQASPGPRPGRTRGKVLAEWNAMAVAALAYAGMHSGAQGGEPSGQEQLRSSPRPPAATQTGRCCALGGRLRPGRGGCGRRPRTSRGGRGKRAACTQATMPG